jgi:hypothetical protein
LKLGLLGNGRKAAENRFDGHTAALKFCKGEGHGPVGGWQETPALALISDSRYNYQRPPQAPDNWK